MTSERVPRVEIGSTGIRTSQLSLGTWGIGKAAAAATIGDDETIISVLEAAFAAGITYLDSADMYENEERLGKLLTEVPNVPDDLLIATKYGHGKPFTADGVRRSVEQSLAALSLERIPLMMLHDPRNDEDMAQVYGAGGALAGLRALQDEGLVGAIGVATGTMAPLQSAVDSGEFDVIQFPRLYTLINRAAKTSGLLERAREKGMGTQLAAPFTGNILATGVRGVDKPLYAYWPAQPEVVEAVGRMQDRTDELGVTIAQAAVAYVATEPLIDVAVIGVRTPGELEQNVASLHTGLPRDQLESIADAGAVDEHLLGGPEFVWPFPVDRAPEELKDVVKG
ncbi:aldo/keto reductase [Microbacterium thalassium]|uniref:D-threo-aldose 1-dehydrogenase n=1 Tax=Microbacterium thalassium TaxID=362649 RepID=A0A7X0KTZ9_9MICO|nr:aldo/keto reductase [Microbacterium thalassium]MBB6390646.1 D-threo-aldose 1-dehydrogenase [Microbacterium thalassium]GLK25755.1 oxidoreductase [Microbacterium thalassium]